MPHAHPRRTPAQPPSPAPALGRVAVGALWVCTIDLDSPLSDLVAPTPSEGGAYAGAVVLVRLHSRPLGQLQLPLVGGALSAEHLLAAAQAELGAQIRAHLAADGLAPPAALPVAGLAPLAAPPCSWQVRLSALVAEPPLVTIVIPTCRRTDALSRTLTTLSQQSYPRLEVLVVDNAPGSSDTARVVDDLADSRFRLISEPVPGASRARNRGLREARGSIVAFTDDDVSVDPDWVGNLVVPFLEDPEVACVTGLVLAARLEVRSEQLFEQFGGFSKGFQGTTFSLADVGRGPLYPYNAGAFGSGNNNAFRRDEFLAAGGFAVDLGPGTHARGGEDLDAYLSVLWAGRRLRFEPAAVVRHAHRADHAALSRQIYGYGVGLSAMVTKRMLGSAAERRRVVSALLPAARYLLSKDSPKNAGRTSGYPAGLVLNELAGLLCGPPAYFRSRSRARRGAA